MNDIRNLDELATSFGRLFMHTHRLLDRSMAASGASLARTKLLMCIDREGPMRAVDIAELFGLAPRTVTEALDGLERAGLVQRSADAQDRRVKRISITAEGKRAIDATEPLRLALVRQIFGALSPTECEQLASIMATLAEQVEAAEAPSGR